MRVLCSIMSLFFLTPAIAQYTWTVDRVIDGDTIVVQEEFYPPEIGKIYVRIKGIDTPEKGNTAKCESEKSLGRKATKFLSGRVKSGDEIVVRSVSRDKYGGRVAADVYHDGVSIAAVMIEQKYAVKYDGKGKKNWCNI